MTNLSCDICYRINVPTYFETISEQIFYDICIKFGAEYHKKLLPTDKRYICMDCISTLKQLNNNSIIKYKQKNCFKIKYKKR